MKLGERVHDLRAKWSHHGQEGNVDQEFIERFCGLFLTHQIQLIDAELGSDTKISEWQRRENAHQKFGTERGRVFVGREQILERIARYTGLQPEQSHDEASQAGASSPQILLGSGGSGKSALLARAASDAANQLRSRGVVLVQRYIGGVPGCESLMAMLFELISDIARHYDQSVPQTPVNAYALAKAFLTALGWASAERPLIIFLDSLDQLDEAYDAWALEWMPRELPRHVRIVASIRTGTVVSQAAKIDFAQELIEIEAMTPSEGAAMLEVWLGDKRAAWFNAGIAPSTGRRLTPAQRATVLEVFNLSGSPLWLKLAYEEAVTWASWDSPRRLPVTIQGLIEEFIDRKLIKQENHPKVFTERALAYLSAGRFGLSENELGRVLGSDPAVRKEFGRDQRTLRHWENDRVLPPILWSRLFFDLQAYLGISMVDGAFLMRWFHREFIEVMSKLSLGSEDDRRAIHGALADTFLALERETTADLSDDDLLFRSTDATGQQVSAAMRRVMEQPWQLAQAGRQKDLETLVTDFGFCTGKCAANRAADLAEDLMRSRVANKNIPAIESWNRLFRQKGHILRRGDTKWPAHKILLQIAMEDVDTSPLRQAAETWLSKGLCTWKWMRKLAGSGDFCSSPLLSVMEGHRGRVNGVLSLSHDTLVSWSDDASVRIWNTETGAALTVMRGHAGPVERCYIFGRDRLLSLSADGTMRVWETQTGMGVAVMETGIKAPQSLCFLPDGNFVTWPGLENTLQIWDGAGFRLLGELGGYSERLLGALLLPDGRLMSWADDQTLRVWDIRGVRLAAILEPQEGCIQGVMLCRSSFISLHSSRNAECRVICEWDIKTLECLKRTNTGIPITSAGLENEEVNFCLLDSDDVAIWFSGRFHISNDTGYMLPDEGVWIYRRGTVPCVEKRELRDLDKILYLRTDGKCLFQEYKSTQEGRYVSVCYITNSDKKVCSRPRPEILVGGLSWDEGYCLALTQDGEIQFESDDGATFYTFSQGHGMPVRGTVKLDNDRIASYSEDGSIAAWSLRGITSGKNCPRRIAGVLSLMPSKSVLWSWDGSVGFLDTQTGKQDWNKAIRESNFGGIQSVSPCTFLIWSKSGGVTVIDSASGEILNCGSLPTNSLFKVSCIGHSQFIAHDTSGAICYFEIRGLEIIPKAVSSTHKQRVFRVFPLIEGGLLSWSSEGCFRVCESLQLVSSVETRHCRKEICVIPSVNGLIVEWDKNVLSFYDENDGSRKGFLCADWDIADVCVLGDGRIIVLTDGALLVCDGNSREWLKTPLRVTERDRRGRPRRWIGGDKVTMSLYGTRIEGMKWVRTNTLVSWTAEGSIQFWNLETYQIENNFDSPWTDNLHLLRELAELDAVGNALRSGSQWIEKHSGMYLNHADGEDGEIIRWHGQAGQLFSDGDDRIVSLSADRVDVLGIFRVPSSG